MAEQTAFPEGNPDNPRTITPARAAQLRRALKKFGDLGGIVINKRTGHLVGGHQRAEAFRDSKNREVVVTTTHPKPTPAGTMVEGFIVVDGERFAYREVDWDEKTEKAASLAANKQAGDWDFTKLAAWIDDLKASDFDLSLTMFDDTELAPFLPEPDSFEAPGEDGAGDAPSDPANTDAAMPDAAEPAEPAPVNYVVKTVQLFYDKPRYDDFIKLTEALGEAYGHNNVSDTVFEALTRAAVSQAL